MRRTLRTSPTWVPYFAYLLAAAVSLFLWYPIAEASIGAIVSTILPDFRNLRPMQISCTVLITQSESVIVSVRIPQNSTAGNLHYSPTLRMASVPSSVVEFRDLETRQVELHPSQSVELTWTEQPLPSPSRNLIAWVWAPSEEDLSIPLPQYPTANQAADLRSTSYEAACGIAILPISGIGSNAVLVISLILLVASHVAIMRLTNLQTASTAIRLIALALTVILALGPSAALLRHGSLDFWAMLYLAVWVLGFSAVLGIAATIILRIRKRPVAQ